MFTVCQGLIAGLVLGYNEPGGLIPTAVLAGVDSILKSMDYRFESWTGGGGGGGGGIRCPWRPSRGRGGGGDIPRSGI